MQPRPKALSIEGAINIRQPYAELILSGRKTIEYQSRPINIRGRVYIYARLTPGDDEAFVKAGVSRGELPTGVIVGSIEITDCTEDDGVYLWHLTKPERLKNPLKPKNEPQSGIWRPQF